MTRNLSQVIGINRQRFSVNAERNYAIPRNCQSGAAVSGRVIPHPAPAYQQQSASEGFFWLVIGLGFAGAAIVFAARLMGLL